MGGGVFFCKRWKIGGCFCKKVENKGVFVKKVKKWGFVKKVENGGGVICKKSGPFLNAGCIMHSISIFYFTFYLFGGMRTHPTHPLPTGL